MALFWFNRLVPNKVTGAGKVSWFFEPALQFKCVASSCTKSIPFDTIVSYGLLASHLSMPAICLQQYTYKYRIFSFSLSCTKSPAY